MSLSKRLMLLETLASELKTTPEIFYVSDDESDAVPDASIPLVAVVSQGLGVKIYRYGKLQTD